jgi:hypothetical protein
MIQERPHPGKAILALGALIACLLLTMGSFAPARAMAGTSPFCGGTLGGFGTCKGTSRTMYKVEGWGLDHSVCVTWTDGFTEPPYVCSSGPGVHVSMNIGANVFAQPIIHNNASGSNRVQGIAYQP